MPNANVHFIVSFNYKEGYHQWYNETQCDQYSVHVCSRASEKSIPKNDSSTAVHFFNVESLILLGTNQLLYVYPKLISINHNMKFEFA